MKLKSLLAGLETLEVNGNPETDVTGIHTDSRRIRKGDAFVAVRGNKIDGHEFITEAVEKGVSAIICEEIVGTFPSVVQVCVKDSRIALAQLAAKFYGKPSDSLKVVGVTGTNGKTTTTYLISSILEAAGFPAGIIGTLSYKIGNRELPAPNTTPAADELQELIAQMIHAGMKAVVMEVSSHSLVQHRVDAVNWDAAVFTNLTQDHLDYHKTMQGYFDAKKILFQQLGGSSKRATAVLNSDDSRTEQIVSILGKDVAVLKYGLHENAEVRAEKIEYSISGSRFMLVTSKNKIEITTPLCGAHNVSNCLAAAAIGIVFGIDYPTIQKGIAGLKNVPGRLQRVSCGSENFAVFVDYAHTDDALRNVLKTLRPLAKGRLITVFGAGGNRDTMKRPLMGKVAGELSDINIVTTDNPRYEEPSAIVDHIVAGFKPKKNFEVVLDRKEAIRMALSVAKEGDVVLLAGKGHETYQDVCGTRSPFDDRKIAFEVLESLVKGTKGGQKWKS